MNIAKLRSHLTYANVAATIALFLALTGGVAWALSKNSVRSKHIVNGQVRGVDVNESTLVGVKPYGNVIPSGTTVTGVWGGTLYVEDNGGDFLVSLPAPAPVALTAANVNMGPDSSNPTDGDPACTGSDDAPTAPAGKVCIYEGTNVGGSPVTNGSAIDTDGSASDRRGFLIYVDPQTPANTIEAHGTWAYTAP